MIKVVVFLLQIDPLDEKQRENWATITVNSEIITWASSNDLCTFYRSQPAIEAYDDISVSSVDYSEPPPPPPPAAIIDVIPPTPTSAPLEQPPLCKRCSCDLITQDRALTQGDCQNDDDNKLISTPSTISTVRKVQNALSEHLDGINRKSVSTDNTAKESINKQTNDGTDGTKEKLGNIPYIPNSSASSSVNSKSVAATSTTQHHRSQLCSTAVSLPTHIIPKQLEITSQTHQGKATVNSRPSPHHKPGIKHIKKEQTTTVPTYNKPLPSAVPTTTDQVHAKDISHTTRHTSLTTKPVAGSLNKIDPSNPEQPQNDYSPRLVHYPLKKHPLINIKSRPVVQLESSSLVAPTTKVLQYLMIHNMHFSSNEVILNSNII